jgi:hypothetical protein
MDIQQLRSWIFELYDPLENDRQYIVFDAARANLIVDVPRYSERAVRLIRGTGPAALIVVTNAARAREAGKMRDALGVQIAAHEEDAAAVEGGADVVLGDDQMVRPDARAIRIRYDAVPPGAQTEAPQRRGRAPGPERGVSPSENEGSTVLLLRKAGGVLVIGDLDLTSPAAKALIPLEFSAVLSAQKPPTWNAGRDGLIAVQQELPKPTKRFSILLDAPWDRGYKGRLEDKMSHNDPIVPREVTVAREAGMGPETLVVSEVTRERIERAPRPVRDGGTR